MFGQTAKVMKARGEIMAWDTAREIRSPFTVKGA